VATVEPVLEILVERPAGDLVGDLGDEVAKVLLRHDDFL
jgi:hypothetical protein